MTSHLRFVFLVYVARSGSTVLARQVALACPRILVLPEMQLPDVLLRFGGSRIGSSSPRRLLALLELDPQLCELGLSRRALEQIARDSAGTGIRAIIERVIRELEPTRSSTADVVLLKKGSLIEHTTQLRHAFPTARFLHVRRDPRGVASSMLRSRDPYGRGRMGRSDPYYIGRYWRRFQRRIERARDGLTILDVQYEDLLRDPAEIIGNVADFLCTEVGATAATSPPDIPSREESLHALVSRPPDPQRGDAWKDELAHWEGAAVEHAVGKALSAHGYERYFLPRSRAGGMPAIGIGLLVHLLRTVQHACAAVGYYARHPRRIGLRWRSLTGSVRARISSA